MALRQKQVLAFDEQLTGLSPTVCRRAIAAIREADASAGGEKRQDRLPEYCAGLLELLSDQTRISHGGGSLASDRVYILEFLHQCAHFLDIVEGKTTPAEEQPPK